LPAVGQGIIGIECRSNDARSIALAAALNEPRAQYCCEAERAFALGLQGSCQSPIAGFAEIAAEVLTLRGVVGSADGRSVYRDSTQGAVDQRLQLGSQLAQRMLASGAGAVLAELRGSQA
jgi:hydroxymethylbilane synthase